MKKEICIISLSLLVSACSNQVTNSPTLDSASEFNRGLEEYKDHKGCKAMAVAIKDDRYAFGYGYGQYRQISANKGAISACEKNRLRHKVDKACELVALSNQASLKWHRDTKLLQSVTTQKPDFSDYNDSQYNIQFGILKGNSECEMEAEVTTNIPYTIGKENLKFGYVIKPKTTQKFKHKIILYMPSPPVNVEGQIANSASSVMSEGLSSMELTSEGRSIADAWLTEGDPKGSYRMSLFINNVLAFDISFNVD